MVQWKSPPPAGRADRPAETAVVDSTNRCRDGYLGKQDVKKPRKATAPGKKKEPTNKPFGARFPARATPAAKALATNVRRLREQLELTQGALAKAVKVDQAAISLIELCRSNPTLHLIQAIAKALRTTSAALLSKPARRPTKPD
jgi:DNA-binding XRE family transcriptional regulator